MSFDLSGGIAGVRVTVWNENVHETTGQPEHLGDYYPDGIHGVIASALIEQVPGVQVHAAVLQDPEHGLGADVLDRTDVLVWWGHLAHADVSDEVVNRVHERVLAGMGLIVLHSGHFSKIFRRLLGTTCSLRWRNEGERELVWTVSPRHPIVRGVPSPVVIPEQEMYGEFFDIPEPDELVFISSFSGGEVFRSGVTYRRGNGRIFYFSPGDQEYPVYNQPEIRRIIANSVQWAARPEADRALPAVSNPPRDWFT